MIEYFNATQEHFYTCRVKRAYYLSIEFLMGRTLTNALANTGLTSPFSEAMNEFGEKLEAIAEREQDPGLGSGGLGRLAACFLDSLATLDYPAWGYGIRYKYGQFIQAILHNQQIEVPDFWLETGNPWEILRHDIHYDVGFYGHTEYQASPDGSIKIVWIPGNTVNAVAYDTAIPGFGTHNTLGLRLWSSQPSCRCRAEEALMQDPWETLRLKQRDEEITSVLYPRADSDAGRELRLKQQYFFSSASLQDILRRFAKMDEPLTNLPNHAAIQLNDTHPSISIPELMRLLMDVEDLGWESAWEIVTHVFAFTNHTVMPEALEKWPVAMMERVLPRHLQIIYEINRRFLEQIAGKGFEPEVISKLSIIEEHPVKAVRMANLAIVGSHTVNGVARIHSEILRATIFSDFEKLWPGKIINITNGVTPRRWIHCANPWLSEAITRHLGDSSWVRDLSLIGKLRQSITPQLLQDVSAANRRAKDRLREHLSAITASKVIDVDTSALFDVQVKRIHEYKRQLLNVLGVIHRYLVLKDMTPDQRAHEVKRVHIFAGKAAASYRQAKAVIKLICNVSDVIGNDPETSHYLRAFFLPNYSVSLAELIIPATDVSEHISTAGTEASGTSNMKFCHLRRPIFISNTLRVTHSHKTTRQPGSHSMPGSSWAPSMVQTSRSQRQRAARTCSYSGQRPRRSTAFMKTASRGPSTCASAGFSRRSRVAGSGTMRTTATSSSRCGLGRTTTASPTTSRTTSRRSTGSTCSGATRPRGAGSA